MLQLKDEMAAGNHQYQARQGMGELVGDERMILKQISKEQNERIWTILMELFRFTYNQKMVHLRSKTNTTYIIQVVRFLQATCFDQV